MATKKQEPKELRQAPDNRFSDYFKAPKPVPNLKSQTLFDEPYIEPLGSMNDAFRRYMKESKG